jgi:hypothetical protein
MYIPAMDIVSCFLVRSASSTVPVFSSVAASRQRSILAVLETKTDVGKSYHDIFNQQRFRAIFGSTSPDSKTDSHGGVLKIFHANLGPLPPNVAIVPNTNGDYVTEVGVGYFKADITQADRQAWLDLQEKHERENMVPWKGYLAYSGGWTVENLPKPRGGEHEHAASISTKPYLGLWAWTSKETHDECAAREVWQEVTKPIGEFPGFLDVDMYHVRMVEVQKQKSAGNQ